MTATVYISSTSRSVSQPQQQIMTFSLVACSSSLSTESWWIRDAGNDAGLAGAADAELAGIVDVDAGIEQHFEHLLALGDEIFLAGARQLDPEAAGAGRRGLVLRREIFDVDVPRGRLAAAASNALSIGLGPQQ